ncbi:uncharacterized protein LOC119982538 [Tripterygium wilfordii]|uniref:uncharacterized protein LOC119982538 n=1 Tax=Tripterygium wilfordii TaxID=458696 RepID=UPI0018F82A4C|nr:uncharacterized protein LOC119982538 [Tripterygium wilfordii]
MGLWWTRWIWSFDLRGQHCLSSTGATKIYINLDIPENNEIIQSYESSSDGVTMIAGKLPPKLTTHEQMITNRKKISDLISMQPPKIKNNVVMVTLLAGIQEVQNKLGWYYFSCENCKRKLEKSGSVYRCDSCNRISVFLIRAYQPS